MFGMGSTPSHPDFVWVSSGGGAVPPNAVTSGFDCGEPIYVGRAYYGGALIPGKVHPSHGCCYVPWGGEEHSVRQYEVLCTRGGQPSWQNCYGSQIPSQAVQGGRTETGEPLYIGRRMHDGVMVPGKVQKSHSCLYIAYAGKEHSYKDFEVLLPCGPYGQPSYPNPNPYPGPGYPYPQPPAYPSYPGYPGTCPPGPRW